jgi:transcriptional regulator with XRE-family HTH domain
MPHTLGARLRSRREERQLSLDGLAERTKIRVSLLEGLERDDVSQWPRGIFRRSWVRTYAQALGLDADAVVREFLAIHPEPADEEVTSVLAAARGITDAPRPRTRLGLLLGSALDALPVRRSAATAAEPRAPAPSNVAPPIRPADDDGSSAAVHLPVTPEPPPTRSWPADDGTEEAAADNGRTPLDAQLIGALERLAGGCGRIASAVKAEEVSAAVADAAAALGATGLILWISEPDGEGLTATVAHGYSARLISGLPPVHRNDENPVATAFRTATTLIVDSAGGATGAVVVPVVSRHGCVGALALELDAGAERDPLVRVMASILAAQLATLVAPISNLNAATA